MPHPNLRQHVGRMIGSNVLSKVNPHLIKVALVDLKNKSGCSRYTMDLIPFSTI